MLHFKKRKLFHFFIISSCCWWNPNTIRIIMLYPEKLDTFVIRQISHIVQKHPRRLKELSRMDNPETYATLSTRHNTKINKTKNTPQTFKMMSNMDLITKTRGVSMYSRMVSRACFWNCTRHVYPLSSVVKVLSMIEESRKQKFIKKEKIYWHLRKECFVAVNQFMMTSVELLLRLFQYKSNLSSCE